MTMNNPIQNTSAEVPAIASMNVPCFAIKALEIPVLRKAALQVVKNAAVDFFAVQWLERLLPGKIPIASVDHELDKDVPFSPGHVHVYMDFIPFWIRTAAWMYTVYGWKERKAIAQFVDGIARLYNQAASVYRVHLSTTERPFYIKRPRFALIHAADPHYACVPSLHVMIVVYSWLALRDFLTQRGDVERYHAQIDELRTGALAITESILFVKQHSVNCVAAAMYAMTKLYGAWLTEEEAVKFINDLFLQPRIGSDAEMRIKNHIITLYRTLLKQGEAAREWHHPLLDFLRSCPR